MLNSFQFSAAKSASEMKFLQALVFDNKKQRRSYSEFRQMAEPFQTKFDQWFRVEYDLASRGSILAEQWQRIWRDRDINPIAVYRTRRDGRVRPEHAELDGLTFNIDSPTAKNLYVPNGWNCRCTWDTTYKGNPVSEDVLKEKIKKSVPDEFQNNVGIDGIFPSKKHSYFDVLPSANDANYNLFGRSLPVKEKLNTRYYSDYHIKLAANEWHKQQPSQDGKDILFRNREWMLNVFMTQESINKIGKKTKGFENIKNTVEHPTELWGRWTDPANQKEVIMTYISFDKSKNSYFVETKGGIVQNAYYRSHGDAKNLRRIGVKFIK